MSKFFIGFNDFKGITNRKDYWLTVIILGVLLFFIPSALNFGFFNERILALAPINWHETGFSTRIMAFVYLVRGFLVLLCLTPFLMLIIRRLRDIGLSGVSVLILIVFAIVLPIVMNIGSIVKLVKYFGFSYISQQLLNQQTKDVVISLFKNPMTLFFWGIITVGCCLPSISFVNFCYNIPILNKFFDQDPDTLQPLIKKRRKKRTFSAEEEMEYVNKRYYKAPIQKLINEKMKEPKEMTLAEIEMREKMKRELEEDRRNQELLKQQQMQQQSMFQQQNMFQQSNAPQQKVQQGNSSQGYEQQEPTPIKTEEVLSDPLVQKEIQKAVNLNTDYLIKELKDEPITEKQKVFGTQEKTDEEMNLMEKVLILQQRSKLNKQSKVKSVQKQKQKKEDVKKQKKEESKGYKIPKRESSKLLSDQPKVSNKVPENIDYKKSKELIKELKSKAEDDII